MAVAVVATLLAPPPAGLPPSGGERHEGTPSRSVAQRKSPRVFLLQRHHLARLYTTVNSGLKRLLLAVF